MKEMILTEIEKVARDLENVCNSKENARTEIRNAEYLQGELYGLLHILRKIDIDTFCEQHEKYKALITSATEFAEKIYNL